MEAATINVWNYPSPRFSYSWVSAVFCWLYLARKSKYCPNSSKSSSHETLSKQNFKSSHIFCGSCCSISKMAHITCFIVSENSFFQPLAQKSPCSRFPNRRSPGFLLLLVVILVGLCLQLFSRERPPSFLGCGRSEPEWGMFFVVKHLGMVFANHLW